LAEYLGFLSQSDVAKNLYHRLRPNRWYHEPTLYESADVVTNRAIDVIEKTNEEPFFLWIHYMEPHRPYGYSPGVPHYGDVDPNYTEMIKLMATAGVESDLSDEQRQQMVNLYDSDIRYMSDSIADLFDYLVKQEYWDETEIIFTADHGEEFGEHGKYYHRNKPYQELIHVPLLYRTPGRTGSRDPEPRQLVDLAPTIFDTHSIDRPEWHDGKDLNSEYSGPIFGFSYRGRLSISVIEDEWKLIKTENESDELYNLQEDPEEARSLAKERPGVVERLRSRIPARINRLRDDVKQIQNDDLSEETKEQLEDLGYVR
jgi:arylsulfatase A-like enzyme